MESVPAEEVPAVEEAKVPAVEEEKKQAEEVKAQAPVVSSGGIDYSNNPAIKAKCHVTIKVKPLGSGAGDIVHPSEKMGNKRLQDYDVEKNAINFIDIGGQKTKPKTFNVSDLIVTPESDQASMYEQSMKHNVERFLDGYSVNVLAYGQTGSGKTYTMLGPAKTFSTLPDEDIGDEIPENFGLVSRSAISILRHLQSTGRTNWMLSMNISECPAFMDPVDLQTKKPCYLDLDINELVGMKETFIKSTADIVRLSKIVETERNTAKTGMNDTSSRSHAVVEIKLYTKDGDNFYINTMKFLDLCGSERFGKTDKSKWNQVQAHGQCPQELMIAIGTNFSLSTLNRVIGNVGSFKKPITGGEKLPDGCQWKEINVTRLLKTSFCGYAFTSFILAISQHEKNGGETFYTMQFAEVCNKMKANVKRPPPMKYEQAVKNFTNKLAEHEKGLKNAGNKKAFMMRTNGSNYCTQMLEVLKTLGEM